MTNQEDRPADPLGEVRSVTRRLTAMTETRANAEHWVAEFRAAFPVVATPAERRAAWVRAEEAARREVGGELDDDEVNRELQGERRRPGSGWGTRTGRLPSAAGTGEAGTGECACPVYVGGRRGWNPDCPAHGGREVRWTDARGRVRGTPAVARPASTPEDRARAVAEWEARFARLDAAARRATEALRDLGGGDR